jgi:hypothetical protein
MITDKQLRTLKPTEKVYKVADQQGLYATVLRTGNISFRYDYRLNGRRETLVIGQYDPTLGTKNPREVSTLEYGMSVSLDEARLLLGIARRAIEHGESSSAENRLVVVHVMHPMGCMRTHPLSGWARIGWCQSVHDFNRCRVQLASGQRFHETVASEVSLPDPFG